jgi:class 3 adenylate cyclase
MRVERTFCFLDLCGFTAYTEHNGDAAAVAVLARLRAVLRVVTEERGVRISKWLGDGAMLSGLEPQAVVACANEARDQMAGGSPLALRGGIVRGRVIMFEGDDYVGGAVNAAARLCRAAAPNQVLAAADVFAATDADEPCFDMVHEQKLDGIPRPVPVIEIRSAIRAAGVGRDARAVPLGFAAAHPTPGGPCRRG